MTWLGKGEVSGLLGSRLIASTKRHEHSKLWAGSHAPIFFDFGSERALSWLIAGRPDGPAYVGPGSRASFIEMQRGGVTQTARDFDKLMNELGNLVTDYESNLQPQALRRDRVKPLRGFQQYLALTDRGRIRF